MGLYSLLLAPLLVFSLLPTLLTILAIVDIVRTGASYIWIAVVLMAPGIGAIAYFLVERSPLSARAPAGSLSPGMAERRVARRQLKALEIQAAHWRGPAILAEMGDCHLILGDAARAERLYAEAVETKPDDRAYRYGLASALDRLRRYADALPHLERVTRGKPDYESGQADLKLARALDETGRKDDAERELRALLGRHAFPEARARLARLLRARGAIEEAASELRELETEGKALPRYLRREQWRWVRAGHRIARGGTRLPAPYGGPSRLARLLPWGMGGAMGLVVVVASVLWAGSAFYMRTVGLHAGSATTELRRAEQAFQALDRTHPARLKGPPEAVVLAPEDVDRYLRVRRALQVSAPAPAAGASPDDSDGADAMARMYAAIEGRAARRRALAQALTGAQLGPADFATLAGLIEWRLLGRPEALVLGIPPHHRQAWIQDLASEGWLEGAARDDAQHRIAELEAAAHAARGADSLAPATRALLETRRAELEALPAADPELLAPLEPFTLEE